MTAGRDLIEEEAPAPNAAVVVFANPAYGDVGQPSTAARAAGPRSSDLTFNFPSLPGTENEAQAIRKLMPQASVYSGRSATETAIKSLHSPRILHIATHGFFLPNLDQDTERRGQQALDRPPVEAMNREDPLVRAGLALACVNQPCGGPDDGILTALEATTLDLQGTQLVVLSACDTGVGDVVNGDGIYGLRRAFHIAGAEHTMISLWKVDDFATSDLMTEFYRQLATGSAPQDALASVQRRWVRQGNRQHPFYWASFLISDR